MIEKIIEYSIRNRFLVLFLAAALAVAGVYATLNTPVDAIPDLSENQVIVFTDWMGRSPQEIEDQITYPLSRKLQGLAGIKAVRATSEFNYSMITLIFEDWVDFYFARQRVTERLAEASNFLPPGIVPYLAPDATALGQVFFYTVEPSPAHPMDPGRLWALNKFDIVPVLNSAAGVADVATLGGMPLEYQIDVRPESLRAYGITLGELYSAVAKSNLSVGGGVIQKNNAEYLVRSVGWIRNKKDVENTVIKEVNGAPIYVKNLAVVQFGTQPRRGVYEKDGNEVVGGIVLMRHGQNPLAVTQRVKEKIQELQPSLPQGVRIIPAYDRTHLITGAIHTLTEVMWHEMVIASLAILLILMHVRSVFVICVTLPLSVLFSFLLMWVLRTLGIIDIQANIMSLGGITISIGILVDQAIVMTENATHHLKDHFGDQKVTGDTREMVVAPCRTVGRPIFFSVMIMLISFIPVFMLTGREGKYFHPLAFTKSFALIGTAIISVTVVPALIPTFIRGRLRREEENWIVRSFINIYKPVLQWALPRFNLVMWMFAVLLILAAGMFPLQAIIGLGTSETAWRTSFFIVLAFVTGLTVIFTRGFHWQLLSAATLIFIGLWAYGFTKIGVDFMPALDEGTTLDMPSTVPRASVTLAADDLKHRDGLLRGFPEVESVIGKAGRANTPTDPAPLDMVETIINFRPKALWPKRVLKFNDAAAQTREVLRALEERGYVLRHPHDDDRDAMINDATQKALERFDETMRDLALLRYRDFERELSPILTRFVVSETVRRFKDAGVLNWPQGVAEEKQIALLVERLTPDFGPWLAKNPALEDVTRISKEVAGHLKERGVLEDAVAAFEVHEPPLAWLFSQTVEILGAERKTFISLLLESVTEHRNSLWRQRVREINWELFDRGTEAYTWYAMEELIAGAREQALVSAAPQGTQSERFHTEATKTRLGKGTVEAARAQLSDDPDRQAFQPFHLLRLELEKPFQKRVFLWPRQSGPRGDLVDDEMSRVLQVPGWGNTFIQPIINRIEMLSTGIRTLVGIKVFGPDLATINRTCSDIEAAVKPITGARDVLIGQIAGEGYLQIDIDREKAARYGISVEDIQNEIEVALGGRIITYTVEKRDRFPVRIRYARASREDEEAVKRLLVSAGSMAKPMPLGIRSNSMASSASDADKSLPAMGFGRQVHEAAPGHAAKGTPLIPLASLATVRIVEGPSMIRSEDSKLVNYVTLNVRGRDSVGFVDEAKRAVAQKVSLPDGVHVEWTGEYQHQERAAKTLRLIFPAVIVLIFVILYLTYKDLADAALMMLAVPEALAGGAFFLFLWPAIRAWDWSTPPMDFSVAVWVGFIACFGMATETGIIMLVYLREAIEKRGGLENIKSLDELRQAVIEGAVHRLRPKLLTEGVAIIAIFPMVFATGVGGEILAPMALPVLGGLLISDEVVDLFLPVRFYWVRRARWLKLQEQKKLTPALT
ncbi:MAG: efflux RND transporter permease subunit [Gemmataceae bacterium]|nr:efflux RND transporter permease subunit [Gemmataceae bacterium]